jgi:hypothetical protein
VAACSEGGGGEVDGGSMTMTKSLRKRTAMTRSEGGVEAACSGGKTTTCSGAGSSTTGGGGGATVSRVTVERERA